MFTCTNDAVMDAFLNVYNELYDALYEGRLNLTTSLSSKLIARFDIGDYNRDVLLMFNERRGDIVSSDREVLAFMLTYECHVRYYARHYATINRK